MKLAVYILAVLLQVSFFYFAFFAYMQSRENAKDIRKIKAALQVPLAILMRRGDAKDILAAADKANGDQRRQDSSAGDDQRRPESHDHLHKNRFDLN